MMDFLSDVFEFDVDSISDSVHRGPLYLKLCVLESPADNHSNSGIVFSFKVKGEQELKEIVSKYNFFLYRKSGPGASCEKLDLVQIDKKKILTISDVDQRLWRFEFEASTRPDV